MATSTASPHALPPLTDAIAGCGNPGADDIFESPPAQTLARVFKAMGDPTRLRLLSLIAASVDSEACVCELTDPVGLSQPTVSHHLKLLVDAGLITREQRGKRAYYRVVHSALADSADALRRLAAAR